MGSFTPNPKDFMKGFDKTFEDNEIVRNARKLTDGWKGTLAGNDGMDESVAEGQCNMTAEGEYCPKHGLEECGIYEYTGNWTNFGLEETDELAQLKKLALGK